MITQKQIEELREAAKLAAEFSDPISNAARRMGFPYAATPQVILDLLARLDGLSEALEFYANRNEWIDFKEYGAASDGKLHRVDSHFDNDNNGERARTALEKFGVEKGKGDK